MSGTAIKSMLTLIWRGQASLVLSARHDPATFYRTRAGLHVWDDFKKRVVAKARTVEAGTSFKVNVDELGADLIDEKIESGLPQKHLFDESDLCAIIAEAISKQPDGKEGDLENTGKVNLFYTESCLVRVFWFPDGRDWNVYAWRRVDVRWGAGFRVFSPAN